MAHTFLPGYGDYKHLRVYQVTEAIYDLTYHFAHRYLSSSDRTMDQMIQAARSGKQNIAEGNLASSTSSETEIKLTNVARASLGELSLIIRTTYACAPFRYGMTHIRVTRACADMRAAMHLSRSIMSFLPK